MALHYCKKCGRVVEIKPDKLGRKDDTCDYCKSKVYPVPEKYWLDGLDFLITNEQKELLREELVKRRRNLTNTFLIIEATIYENAGRNWTPL